MPNITLTAALSTPNSFGMNLLENGSFEAVLPADLAAVRPNDLFVGWQDLGTSSQITRHIETTAAQIFAGTKALYFTATPSVTYPANTAYQTTQATTKLIPVKPGDVYYGRFTALALAAIGAPGGFNLNTGAYMRITSAGGNVYDYLVGILVNADLGTGWQIRSGRMTVPTTMPDSTSPAYMTMYVYSNVYNTNGSPVTLTSNLMWDIRFDNVELYRAVNPTSDEILKFGILPPVFAGSFTYTNTTSSINWIWNFLLYRVDNAASTVTLNSSQNVTGLATGTSYNFYPFMDEATQALTMVATGGSGTPAWAHTGTSRVWTVEQCRADHVPLSTSPMPGSTAAAGTGGGSGPPVDSGCLVLGTFVKERTKGVIACELVEAGDYLWSEGDTWVKVLSVRQTPHELWADLEFSCGQKLRNTEGHPYKLTDQSIKRAYELCLADEVPSSTGITNPVAIELLKEPLTKVAIECEEPHTFFAASLPHLPWVLTHNYNTA